MGSVRSYLVIAVMLVAGCSVRVTGPESFRIDDAELAELIGLDLPQLSDDVRASLLAQARALT